MADLASIGGRLMGFTDLFWFFIIFPALQPILRQKMLQVQRLRILRRLERQRNSLAITLIHRQETMSFLGFPILRYIDINYAEHVLFSIRSCGHARPTDLTLQTLCR